MCFTSYKKYYSDFYLRIYFFFNLLQYSCLQTYNQKYKHKQNKKGYKNIEKLFQLIFKN